MIVFHPLCPLSLPFPSLVFHCQPKLVTLCCIAAKSSGMTLEEMVQKMQAQSSLPVEAHQIREALLVELDIPPTSFPLPSMPLSQLFMGS